MTTEILGLANLKNRTVSHFQIEKKIFEKCLRLQRLVKMLNKIQSHDQDQIKITIILFCKPLDRLRWHPVHFLIWTKWLKGKREGLRFHKD